MRSTLIVLSAVAALAAPAAGRAQSRPDGAPRVGSAERGVTAAGLPNANAAAPNANDPAGVLGLTAAPSGGERDSLGLLVGAVAPDGPADHAGVDAGSRLAAVNGVSLRAEDGESADVVQRRLARALRAVKPGDDVTLRLFRAGRFRDVVVHTAPAVDEVVPAPRAVAPRVAVATDAEPTPRVAARAATEESPATIAALLDATARAQTTLRRLVAQEEATGGPMLDTLDALEQDLGDLQRRIRAAQARAAQPAPRAGRRRAAPAVADDESDDVTPAPARASTSSTSSASGIRVATVTEELAPYYGDDSEGGLLVLEADASWSPVRAGDVVLRVNGAPATAARLRAAQAGTRAARIELLRHKRDVEVVLEPQD